MIEIQIILFCIFQIGYSGKEENWIAREKRLKREFLNILVMAVLLAFF